MACVAVNSLVRTIELEFLQPLPRPIVRRNQLIPGNEKLIQNLHQKLGDLIELLDENRMDGIQAIKDLETKLRDVAFRVEDEIEFLIVDLYDDAEEEDFGIADLFGEKPQRTIDAEEDDDLGISADLLFVEKPEGETSYSLKLGCILEEAIRDIDAIHKELSKVKMEYAAASLQGIGIGRKTTTTASTTCCSDVMMMAEVGDSSHHQHASHSHPLQGSSIMVGKNNEFQIVKAMLIEHSSRQREIVSIKGMGGIGKTTLARRVYEDPSVALHFDIRAWVVASQYHNKLQMLTDLLKSMGCVGSDTQEDQLAQQLYQNLMHQRYFVVIDDIWSVEAWDSVRACFPDNGNGSRVLLTTRSAEVATIIGSNNEFSHQMQFLDEGESWNLFHEKTSKSLGYEFDMIGRQIVEKCKGLPLAIVVAAGLFSKLHTLDEWKNVAKALNSSATTTTTIDEECSRILSSSYNYLPHSLKACFLYLSIFPEDVEIHVKEIVKLWVAEGLVKASDDMSFDAVARRHIQELNDRNLILVSMLSCCRRKVKAFRMHDLLHSFCVREAKKEKLLHIAYRNGSTSPPKDFRWVSIQSKRFDEQAFSLLKKCRSIFFFYMSERLPEGFILYCSLLRVACNINVLCKNEYLIHLRCLLSVLPFQNILKPFQSWNLQTLWVFGSINYKMSFLEFPQLQHFRNHYIPMLFPKCFHQNLKSIGKLRVDHCRKEYFTSIPHIEKVAIDCEGGWKDCINNIAYLHQLQRLVLSGYRTVIPNNNSIASLKHLMKLRICRMTFECRAINIFSKLPKLEVLKLMNSKWIGGEWELFEKESFDQLIYLRVSESNLVRWKASACHFPNLERLVIYWCKELEKIPAEFAEIPNLKSIELMRCLHSAVDSAKEIQREQHEQGNDNMVVIEEYTIEAKHLVLNCYVEATLICEFESQWRRSRN